MCGGPPGRPEARRQAQTGFASVPGRLELIAPEAMASPTGRVASGAFRCTPPIRRTPMAPTEWPATILSRLFRRTGARGSMGHGAQHAQALDRETVATALLRRTIFIMLGLAQTAAFAYFMATKVFLHGQRPLEIAILILFAILFTWVSLGSGPRWRASSSCVWAATATRSRRSRPPQRADRPGRHARPIVMPICNENVRARLRRLARDLRVAGAHRASSSISTSSFCPTATSPTRALRSWTAWLELCRAVDGFGRIFYRRRQHRIKRKSGNVADFCRRWGSATGTWSCSTPTAS